MTRLNKFRNWWRQSDIRIFLWAIARSDISGCQFFFVLPAVKVEGWYNWAGDRFVKIEFKIPRIALSLSARAIDDFARVTGIEPDRYFTPF